MDLNLSDLAKFQEFQKIYRLSRECVISEKIDGTNSQVIVLEDGETVLSASRNRLLTPENDNFGFAKWVKEHESELKALGPGRHYGEWWGSGIQRGYGLKEKRFSLFNTSRWGKERPSCCHVVPVIYQGLFQEIAWIESLESLKNSGSYASPGFMNPEGIVIFHVPSQYLFKKTLEKDEEPKGLRK